MVLKRWCENFALRAFTFAVVRTLHGDNRCFSSVKHFGTLHSV